MKLCRRCSQIKPRRFFRLRPTRKDGLDSYCAPCAVQVSKQYADANRDAIKAKRAQHYLANRERYAARNRAWRESNRDRHRELARAAYERNRGAYIARATAWDLAHPEERRERTRRRRARIAGVAVARVDYAAILDAHGPFCHLCSESIEPADLQFDHVIPIARGGPHSADNIRPAHAVCNARKGTKLVAELAWAS